MALKVTALTYLPVLKSFNVGQKRLYDLFVDIAGFNLDAYITKDQVKNYLNTRLKLEANESELNEFFRLAKKDSNDTNPERITAVEYYMNVHAYAIDPIFKNPLAAKIAALNTETINELDAWLKRINGVIEDAKKIRVRL